MKNIKTVIRNILIAPAVLLIRVPVMINYYICEKFVVLTDNHKYMLPEFEAVKK